MVDSTGRRRFLQLTGTGTVLSIAGCNARQSNDGSGPGTGSPTSSDADTSPSVAQPEGRTAAIQVQPDQQELQQRQREIQQRVQNGDLSRQEAQQEMQSVQQELLGEVAESFESRVSDSPDLRIGDSIDQFGVFLVSGSPGTLIDSLSYEEVGAMFAEETFQQAKSQAEQGAGGQPGQGTETPSG